MAHRAPAPLARRSSRTCCERLFRWLDEGEVRLQRLLEQAEALFARFDGRMSLVPRFVLDQRVPLGVSRPSVADVRALT